MNSHERALSVFQESQQILIETMANNINYQITSLKEGLEQTNEKV